MICECGHLASLHNRNMDTVGMVTRFVECRTEGCDCKEYDWSGNNDSDE